MLTFGNNRIEPAQSPLRNRIGDSAWNRELRRLPRDSMESGPGSPDSAEAALSPSQVSTDATKTETLTRGSKCGLTAEHLV